MTYHSFTPATPLRPYIEKYWVLSSIQTQQEIVTLMPDRGVTLVLNLGENVQSRHFKEVIGNESLFLVGTMLRWDEQVLQGESRLLGVQFRPGAFVHFYRYESMDKVANQVQEFSRSMFPDMKKTIHEFLSCLDRFYLDRLSSPKHSLMSVLTDIEQHSGQIKIAALAKRHFTTERQLERHFNEQIGVSPKEFINLTRFQHAFGKIQQNKGHKSISDIAWDCGYYDHAHLTNDFKRYTGTTPTGLILSDFSKAMTF